MSMSMIVYVKTGCPWCGEVLDFLHEKKVIFEERNVTDNKAYYAEMVAKSGQTKAPTLDIDGHSLADSDKAQVEKYLQEKGSAV